MEHKTTPAHEQHTPAGRADAGAQTRKALMRLIHTSDWHLGQMLHGQERDFEHTAFLAWLLDTLVSQQADALLIAGDVFDTVNPPLKAQERLYDFIVTAHQRLPRLDIVMIAGNHDSGGRIELPAPLMRRLNAHALGRVNWLDDGNLDSARLLLPLHRADGSVGAWCLALPFLRPAEVTGGEVGDDYLAGIDKVHRKLIAAAEAQRAPDQALVAVSHAHMAGAAVSEDSERNIVIGNAEALPASLFPEAVAYVALGHLHKPQQVAGQARIRYSGAPLPLSFAEVNYPHQVLLVELDGSALRAVEPLSVPRAVDMLRIGPKPMAEVLEQLAALPASELARERQPWLEVRVQLEQPQPDLRQQIETALDGKGCRLVRIASEYRGSQEEALPLVGLDQLSPQELFRRSWQAEYGNEADAQVLQDFMTLLQAVELEGEPA